MVTHSSKISQVAGADPEILKGGGVPTLSKFFFSEQLEKQKKKKRPTKFSESYFVVVVGGAK